MRKFAPPGLAGLRVVAHTGRGFAIEADEARHRDTKDLREAPQRLESRAGVTVLEVADVWSGDPRLPGQLSQRNCLRGPHRPEILAYPLGKIRSGQATTGGDGRQLMCGHVERTFSTVKSHERPIEARAHARSYL